MGDLIDGLSHSFKVVGGIFAFVTVVLTIVFFLTITKSESFKKTSETNEILQFIIRVGPYVWKYSGIILIVFMVVLLIIYILWSSIITYVPPIVLIPITVFPFILPIPLQWMLLQIYPFPDLTDRGVLPLMHSVISRFFEYLPKGMIPKWFGISTKEIFAYFFDDIKKFLEGIFVLDKNENLLEGENKKKQQIPDKPEEPDASSQMKALIEKEVQLCIKSKMATRTNESSFTGVMDVNAYADCYSIGFNSYFNKLLQ